MEIDQAIEILESHLYSGKMPSKAHFEALALAVETLKRQQWHPISEQPPEHEVLAVSTLRPSPYYGEMLIGYVCEDTGSETGYCCENENVILHEVTHWREKPELPMAVRFNALDGDCFKEGKNNG